MDKTSNILPASLDGLNIQEKQAARKPDANALGQEQFLELMVTQLENQDPFKPMESGDFLGQIAQFSTVSGITDLQETVSSLATSLQSNQALQASTMVGRRVVVPADRFSYAPGETAQVSAQLESTAGNVRVSIYDEIGQLVRQTSLGQLPAGPVAYRWDGFSDAGKAMPAGRYSVAFDAVVDGEEFALQPEITARVDSVTLSRDGTTPTLNVDGFGAVAMSDVREIL
ncbi:MAG: flagellar hook assembly protein FlgD [Gammaproteobacteria bacterium]